jgi:MYXO-CTERM domain-containing protein
MRTSLLLLLLVAFALPAAAFAKGPDYATISGPGISGSIRIDGDGEGGDTGTPLGALVSYGGYASQAFGHHPVDPTTKARPQGRLGPRYHIVYSVPTPTGRSSIEADLYPYATPRPLTYMRPGQPFFEMHTYGGWYVAKPGLMRTLHEAGVLNGGGDSHTWRWVGIGALALVGLVAAAAVRLRRRPQSAPAPVA